MQELDKLKPSAAEQIKAEVWLASTQDQPSLAAVTGLPGSLVAAVVLSGPLRGGRGGGGVRKVSLEKSMLAPTY